jgi:hypothetical protein
MKIIEITVSLEGKITIQTIGFAGGSCLEAGKFLEETLGQRTAEQKTAEFYEVQTGEQIQQRHGA